jgi:ATP-binding cassette, subfamily C, bacterial
MTTTDTRTNTKTNTDTKKRITHKRVKTPTLLQMESVECGAAALGIILSHYGRIVPLAELRRECGVSRDGSKASNVLKAARRYGMETKGYKKQLDSLLEIKPPYIVFWNFNHFLVVEGFGQERVFLNDPGSGPRTVSWEEFDEAYTGVILTFQPGKEFKKAGKKPSLLPALVERLSSSVAAIIYCLVAGFLLVLPGLVIPVLNQVFIDNIIIDRKSEWLRPLLLAMGFTAFLQISLHYLQQRYLRQLKIKLSVGTTSRFIWHLLRLPTGFYAQRFAGEISSRVDINDKVSEILSGKLASTTIDIVMLVFYATVMFTYDWVLTLIGIFFAVVNVLTLQFVSRQRVDANMRLARDLGKVAGTEIAGLQGIETIKSAALESDFFAKWSGYHAQGVNSIQALSVTQQTIGLLPVLLNSLTTILILVVGGLRVMNGNLSIGMLVAFRSLMDSFQAPVNTLINFAGEIQELEGDINRLDDVLNNPIDPQLEKLDKSAFVELEKLPLSIPTYRLRGHVELKNVSFGYSRVEDALIQDFNLSIKPGQRIALVGGSGSGKSTVAKIISGLYQAWEGEILFDGKTVSEIPRSVMTNSLAVVEQEILLFAGSVRDNLTLWDATIPDAQLIRACMDASIHDVLIAIPGGYNGELMEGAANLSGGQRQRLEIARALVNNPSILIMDEATSALDTESEKIIDQNLRRRGCTCIIVAHRLSTIRDCDEIIVMEKGKIVQRGTHDELWEMGGYYAGLIKSEGQTVAA